MKSKRKLPLIGITMGDPVGIGPEIIVKAIEAPDIYSICNPLVIGDKSIIKQAVGLVGSDIKVNSIDISDSGIFTPGTIDILETSKLDIDCSSLKQPTIETGKAMEGYIIKGIDMALGKKISGLVTCPITKTAMKLAGSKFHGHTELLAHRTQTQNYAMMLAGEKLKVVLVTIHIPLSEVAGTLTMEEITRIIRLTDKSLKEKFNIQSPKIGVAGLNPHAGEDSMFGPEEEEIITPAVEQAQTEGINASGPLPPDTIFHQSVNGKFDAVVCMYHDQGLIPFKLIHFENGVNTTLGLPIIRTSVDHGTAYDIAWKGIADHSSLTEAIKMAAFQASNAG